MSRDPLDYLAGVPSLSPELLRLVDLRKAPAAARRQAAAELSGELEWLKLLIRMRREDAEAELDIRIVPEPPNLLDR